MRKFIDVLSSLRLSVILLLLLSVLVVWGTLYQAEHGLYAAQVRFYRSYVVMIGGLLPFPGTQLVMLLLFLNLLSATIAKLRYRWRHTGSILTHVGLLILLAGGFLIRLHARESQLTLEEGEGSNVAVAYHDWEISVWDPRQATPDPTRLSRQVTAIDCRGLRSGERLTLARPAVTVDVLEFHANAAPLMTSESGAAPPVNATGFAALRAAPRQKEPAADIPGCRLNVTDRDGKTQEVLLYGRDREATRLELDGGPILWSLRRLRQPLPFTLVLNDFKREMHAQSSMARSYSSDVTVHIAGIGRDAHIAMNEPLHYGGFTLFQSSYQELADGREFSTFAVVANYGRYIPYAGSLVVFIGMLVHFVSVLYRKGVKYE